MKYFYTFIVLFAYTSGESIRSTGDHREHVDDQGGIPVKDGEMKTTRDEDYNNAPPEILPIVEEDDVQQNIIVSVTKKVNNPPPPEVSPVVDASQQHEPGPSGDAENPVGPEKIKENIAESEPEFGLPVDKEKVEVDDIFPTSDTDIHGESAHTEVIKIVKTLLSMNLTMKPFRNQKFHLRILKM